MNLFIPKVKVLMVELNVFLLKILVFLDPERQDKGSITITFFVSCLLVSGLVS